MGKDFKDKDADMLKIEGRQAVREAFRAGRSIDRLLVQENVFDGPVKAIIRQAKEAHVVINYLPKEKMDATSESGRHQGVIALAAAADYASLDDILNRAAEKGEPPFIILLDSIEDPHNLGALIRTAEVAGAHGIVITKHHASGLTSTVMRTSAGALNYMPICKVTNLTKAIEELKQKGVWFVCADMDGETMYDLNLTGSMGVVVGNEGSGVSRLVRESCDYVASVPMFGQIKSLNASVAGGILMYEIVRQRMK
ncbi:MAG: 23S rRNA (guanosine(2251)-2'-O)-methyltransferase RlmB [Lachnospiraceae bacterium]|nr:23S rRNA (guanosine(2251)-2'-O)-methyltransferase RlmB [Candidatus Equihabitans merdae]